jgi:putative Holliday junction resolvase
VTGTLLAFDFGERRIGVAVGETATGIANPLTTIAANGNDARFAAIEKLVREWHPQGFVVGRPRHADGAEHPVARLATRFARRLAGRYDVPVVLVDETLTSQEAEATLRSTRARAARPGDVDALAASLILQSFLDQPDAHERLAP